MAHLHLVREVEPDVLDPIQRIYCSACRDYIYVIHLDRPPEDPE